MIERDRTGLCGNPQKIQDSADVKHPPPWLFALTGPALRRGRLVRERRDALRDLRSRIQIDAIGWYGALLQLPPCCCFSTPWSIRAAPQALAGPGVRARRDLSDRQLSCAAARTPRRSWCFAAAAQIISGWWGAATAAVMAAASRRAARQGQRVVPGRHLSGGGLSATLAIWMVGEHTTRWRSGDPGRPDGGPIAGRAVDRRAAQAARLAGPGVSHTLADVRGCCSAGSG